MYFAFDPAMVHKPGHSPVDRSAAREPAAFPATNGDRFDSLRHNLFEQLKHSKQASETGLIPSQVSDILLPAHVLHLLKLIPVVLDLNPRQTVEITRTSISTHCEDTIFRLSLCIQFITGKFTCVDFPQYLSAARSYALAAFSSMSYPPKPTRKHKETKSQTSRSQRHLKHVTCLHTGLLILVSSN